MIADLVEALNVVVWVSLVVMPPFAAVMGWRGQKDRFKRAMALVACLIVLLVSSEVTLGVLMPDAAAEVLSSLGQFRFALLVTVVLSMGLSFALYALMAALKARRG